MLLMKRRYTNNPKYNVHMLIIIIIIIINLINK
jgi:hypothetical protein